MTFRLVVASVLQILTGTFNMLQVLDSIFKNILMNFVRSDFSILANRYGISLLPSKLANWSVSPAYQ